MRREEVGREEHEERRGCGEKRMRLGRRGWEREVSLHMECD
jgi:hypothetical protein